MPTLYEYIRLRCDRSLRHRIEREAATRNCSLSKCARDCLAEYFALQDEMATAITDPGELGDPHTGVIHTLLSRTEERLAKTLDAHDTRLVHLHDTLELLLTMLDRAMLSLLIHLPEVRPEQREEALASGRRRHVLWRRAIDGEREEDGQTS